MRRSLQTEYFNTQPKEKNHLLTGYTFVCDTFQEEARTAGGYQVAGCKKNFSVMNDSPKYWLCLLGLHGSDGKIDHAISIAGGWIFDAHLTVHWNCLRKT